MVDVWPERDRGMISKEYRGGNLVFIVGCPRSGTTWLQRIVAAHPLVKTGQESDVFDVYIGPQLRAWRRDVDKRVNGREVGLAAYFTESEFMGLLREYMIKLLNPMVSMLGENELFVEKTPSHILFVPEIMELLPECRIIHVLRDGRDTVASLLAASKDWGAGWAPRKAVAAAFMWKEHVEAARKAGKTLSGRNFCEVKYEELHFSSEATVKKVFDFIGVPSTEEQIRSIVLENRADALKSGGGTKIPLGGEFAKTSGNCLKEPKNFVRKAKTGSWKEDLSYFERVMAWMVLRKIMKEVGYNWPLP